jgi:hypothetical protein
MAVNKPDPVRNLGHKSKSTEAALTRNPVGRALNYEPASNRVVDGPSRSVGVYKKFSDPKSGISSADNLRAWSKYSTSNSYTGHGAKDGSAKDPPVSDDSRQHVPAASKNSDGYLESTKGWAGYDRGADSGEGRLQKAKKY